MSAVEDGSSCQEYSYCSYDKVEGAGGNKNSYCEVEPGTVTNEHKQEVNDGKITPVENNETKVEEDTTLNNQHEDEQSTCTTFTTHDKEEARKIGSKLEERRKRKDVLYLPGPSADETADAMFGPNVTFGGPETKNELDEDQDTTVADDRADDARDSLRGTTASALTTTLPEDASTASLSPTETDHISATTTAGSSSSEEEKPDFYLAVTSTSEARQDLEAAPSTSEVFLQQTGSGAASSSSVAATPQSENRDLQTHTEQDDEEDQLSEEDRTYFPLLTHVVADIGRESVLERLLVLTQREDAFDFGVSRQPDGFGETLDRMDAFQISKNISRNANLNSTGGAFADVDPMLGALIPVPKPGDYQEEDGPRPDEVDDRWKARLKATFRALAKKWHPDKSRDTWLTAKFQEAAKAYAQLVKGAPNDDDDKHPFEDGEDGSARVGGKDDPGDPEDQVLFVNDVVTGVYNNYPTYLPSPDIGIFSYQDCENSTCRRFIRFHLQLKYVVLIIDGDISHMKKPLFHFARLNYVIDHIQPIDTCPHRNRLCAIFQLRLVETRKKRLAQERHMALIEGGNTTERRLLDAKERLMQISGSGDAQLGLPPGKSNKRLLSGAGEHQQQLLGRGSAESSVSGVPLLPEGQRGVRRLILETAGAVTAVAPDTLAERVENESVYRYGPPKLDESGEESDKSKVTDDPSASSSSAQRAQQAKIALGGSIKSITSGSAPVLKLTSSEDSTAGTAAPRPSSRTSTSSQSRTSPQLFNVLGGVGNDKRGGNISSGKEHSNGATPSSMRSRNSNTRDSSFSGNVRASTKKHSDNNTSSAADFLENDEVARKLVKVLQGQVLKRKDLATLADRARGKCTKVDAPSNKKKRRVWINK
ncbi:unnamed protein product [Amoebophrya sp. A25]|nr:unnamed protein product [Amoebophrya sp. A25]|eukprot:GSA25T00018303001.1